MRLWFVAAGILAVVGLVIGCVAITSGNFSPRDFIESTYVRDRGHDIGRDAIAYVSSRRPSAVAAEITGAWAPADRYVDGSGVYLRYDDDAVVVRPLGSGSVILVEAMRTAYPRYYGVLGGYWGWNTRDGAGFRGGGPGAGK
jgi:hypothetical protein